ncbi:MAG: endo-1,4-beta-xylanase [Bacteroides sp.]|nr:endo-1,4-beta-xylanase [Bacteroides sp.]
MEFSLKEIYKDYFKIGAAVNMENVDTCRELILKHFNSITCENAMKFADTEPEEGRFTFADADKIYGFAKANGIPVRGHNFVWHQAVPEWLFKNTDGEKLLRRLENHIKAVTERYPDLYCWDCINEGIDDRGGYLRKTPWLELAGEDYFAEAFKIAAKYTDAPLFYNDYNEFDPEKRKKIIRKVKEIRDSGARIDGIGLQCHLGLNCEVDFDEIKKGLEEFAALDFKLQITEHDISNYPYGDREMHLAPTFEEYKKQTRTFKEFFKLLREYKNEIETVTFWGVADDTCWLNYFPVEGRKNGGLLFDEDHEPKESFYAICDF